MSLDGFLWPARRWLADRLIGNHGYAKNVTLAPMEWRYVTDTPTLSTYSNVPVLTPSRRVPFGLRPYDQERDTR